MPPNQKNFVLIVLESARGDLLEKKINGITVAPNINALATEGTAIKEAYSHVGYTSPSLKTLFTGSINPTKSSPSLFREFKASGYQIAVFSGQPSSFGSISETVGMRKNSDDIFFDAEKLKEKRAFSFEQKDRFCSMVRFYWVNSIIVRKQKPMEKTKIYLLQFPICSFSLFSPGNEKE
ncbi:sulfatase-like hydrolase/transferase [sulfur-oxidizing endosymbiont of Gigantopelta aegis]|uniref:sulfatase-like hydrolase/transferase n=1 Tax=sulfur-oxidizing endosymbiont of Gigantopelta aegis TaxID=2794934 RepID=UPI003CCCB996